MRILLDNNVDHNFAKLLPGYNVTHARQMGWAELKNGVLIAAAEEARFTVIITADKQMFYQKNLKDRQISIIVLNSWRISMPYISLLAPEIRTRLANLPQGAFITITPDKN